MAAKKQKAGAQKASAVRRRKAGAPTRTREEVVAELVAILRTDGVLATRELGRRVPRAMQLEVYDALTAAGYEVGARAIRTPLDEQILACVRGGPLTLAELVERTRGATLAEVKTSAAALEQRGRGKRVLLGGELGMAALEVAVLDTATHAALAKRLDQLVKLLRAARTKKVGIVRDDVTRAVAALLPGTTSAPARSQVALGGAGLLKLVDEHREASGLTSVPKLVRLLGGSLSRPEVHAELIRLTRAGRMELRPESGMGRLSTEDLALCIPGPQGSKLSWVRRITEEPS